MDAVFTFTCMVCTDAQDPIRVGVKAATADGETTVFKGRLTLCADMSLNLRTSVYLSRTCVPQLRWLWDVPRVPGLTHGAEAGRRAAPFSEGPVTLAGASVLTWALSLHKQHSITRRIKI